MPAWLLVALFGRTPSSLMLAAGLLLVFVVLGGLIWTRFGHDRPVSKCVILSLLAHLLLLVYAYSTNILYAPPGRLLGQTVKVRLRDAADRVEAAPPDATDEPVAEPGPARPVAGQRPAPDMTEMAPAQAAEPEPPSTEQASASQAKQSDSNNDPLSELADRAPTAAEIATVQPAEQAKQAEQEPQPPTAEQQPSRDPPLAAADWPPETAQNLARDAAPAVPPVEQPQFVAATKSPAPLRPGDGQEVPEPLRNRTVADRLKAAQPFGATPQTEVAVAAALDWLASAQSPDGRWDADAFGAGRETRTLGHDRQGAGARADTGISGLALLAFLGSGETHLAGAKREVVQHGLEFLLASQAPDGGLAGQAELYAAMYCHGMATLALSEAYALTGDDRILPGLRRALAYSIAAQTPAGSWRYRPSEPTDPGDMSQFGWQVMALTSADMAGIPLPTATRARMVRFLQSCSLGRHQGLGSYQPGHRASRTMTAESLVCRYFLEAENSPAALHEAAAYLLEECPSRHSPNYYYWYYGTLALFQRQGSDWQRWNAALQGELLARQRWDGQLAGSYDPDDLWGGYGGRVYSTALATLCLEVYYRYLPVHGRDADDSRLTDRPWQPAVAR